MNKSLFQRSASSSFRRNKGLLCNWSHFLSGVFYICICICIWDFGSHLGGPGSHGSTLVHCPFQFIQARPPRRGCVTFLDRARQIRRGCELCEHIWKGKVRGGESRDEPRIAWTRQSKGTRVLGRTAAAGEGVMASSARKKRERLRNANLTPLSQLSLRGVLLEPGPASPLISTTNLVPGLTSSVLKLDRLGKGKTEEMEKVRDSRVFCRCLCSLL